MKNILQLILKGMAVGVANIIPGVSGGTMAVVLGIYEDLIEAIGNILTDSEKRIQHGLFLVKIAFGAVLGVFLLAGLIQHALSSHRELTMLFFMGLILGSMPSVLKLHVFNPIRSGHMALITFGLLCVLLVGNGVETTGGPSSASYSARLLPLFAAGILAGGAMIVPGLSGSLILLLIGQYHAVIRAINELDLVPLATVAVGGVVGILLFAKLIFLAFRFVPLYMHAFILGLVGGSILVLFEGFPTGLPGPSLGFIALLCGTLASFAIRPRPVTRADPK